METDSENPTVRALTRFALAASESGQELPAFPAVAARLVDVLEQPDSSVKEVEQLISQDQAIAAQVLRTANSSVYGAAIPVADVSAAVMRMGFREAASIAMSVACRALFDLEGRAELEVFTESRRSLWHASLVCAYGSRLVAREIGVGDAERAFQGGIFRNVGSLLVLRILALGRIRGELGLDPSPEEIDLTLRALGAPLGARFLADCGLHEAVVAIATHRSGEPGSDSVEATVVGFCEALAAEAGLVPMGGVVTASAAECGARLDLDEARLEYFGLQLCELTEQVKALL